MPPILTEPSQFDTILKRFPHPHILQTGHWAALKAPLWSGEHYLWATSPPPGAAATILTRRLGRLPLRVQYIPKGPVVSPDLGQWQRVLADLEVHARERGALFLKIDPDVDLDSDLGQGLVQILQARGWVSSADQIQYRNTVLSDLTRPESELLADMKQKTRYNVRLAARKGVGVMPSDDFTTFYDLYRQTASRDGFLIRPRSYYLQVMARMQENDLGQLLLAEVAGEKVAGLFLFIFGPTAWYFYGASAAQHRNLMPTYLLQWEAMRWAKTHGCMVYDWWGAPDDLSESDPMWGVFRFKQGFGGSLRRWIGAWDYAPRPRLYQIYTQMMPRLLAIMRRRYGQ